jgi:hypothetical protein
MRRAAPVMPTIQQGHIPAPVGGLNTVSAGSAMPPSDATQLYNMIPAEFGLRSRLGSREWLTGLTGADDNQIRTTFYYHGSTKDGDADRLWLVTSNGIYDATSSYQAWAASTAYVIGDVVLNDDGKIYTCDTNGTSDTSGGPTGAGANIVDGTTRWDYTTTIKKLAFSSTADDAGRGNFHSFTTTGGHFCAYADEENGYHLYTESTDTWAVGAVNLVAEADLAFVASWKHRLWFVEKDTASAWYLDLASIAGDATILDLQFAAKPRHGGDLVGIFNWTLDGGAGIDDFLVFIFRGGDIAIYQGTDPDAADTFALKGVWYAGALPEGRRVATPWGGDLLILTKNGAVPLSKIVSGGEGLGQYVTGKISNLFNRLMLTTSTLPGWAMHVHPEESALIVTHPTTDGANTEQLVMSLATGAWSQYRDLPMYSAAAGGGKLYFGSVDGTVYINDGYIDGVTLADPDSYSAVQWAVMTSFQNLGVPRQKQVQVIRPILLAENNSPEFSAAARYKYNFSELDAPTGGTVTGEEWDGGVWDSSTWAGEYAATTPVRGATGMGVDMAIAVRGTATSRTVLVGIDVAYTQGGFL